MNHDVLVSSISTALSNHSILNFYSRRLTLSLVALHSTNTSGRHSCVLADELAIKWRISLDMARNTLKVTTQNGVHHAVNPLRRRYCTDIMLNWYRRLNTTVYSDTLFSRYQSIKGNKCAQLFCLYGLVVVYPNKSKASAGDALQHFLEDIGVPNEIVVDGSQEQVGPQSDFMKLV